HLPPLARPGDVVAFQPHRLVPAEGHVELRHVDLAAWVRDADLVVHVVRDVDTRARPHGIAPGKRAELATQRGGEYPRGIGRLLPTGLVREHHRARAVR